jgi:TRAP-type uncharacterized transport system fused permease subunit
MEKIILSVSIVVAFFGVIDFVIYSARRAPKSAVLGFWFWVLAFAGLVYVVYTFLPA